MLTSDSGRAIQSEPRSPSIDSINDLYGRCAIGFGLFPPDVRTFKGNAAFHRVRERWEF